MKIFIMRHGEAVAESMDILRPLSDNGREEVAKTAHVMKQKGLIPSIIYHSKKLRARQTAEIIKGLLSAPVRLEEKPFLNPNDDVGAAVNNLIRDTNRDNIMIISHLPFIDHLTSFLVRGETGSSGIKFSEATVAVVHVSTIGKGEINEIISPREDV